MYVCKFAIIIILTLPLLCIKNLYQQHVNLVAGEEGPEESRQQEVVQQNSHCRAQARCGGGQVQRDVAQEQEHLHKQQVQAEVGVYAHAVAPLVPMVACWVIQ